MTKTIEALMAEALEILDHAELAVIEGGYIWGPSCPGYPTDDGSLFTPFGPQMPPIGPIILC